MGRHSEVFKAAAREVRLYLRLSREASIEAEARALVQKIAREMAANHALHVLHLESARSAYTPAAGRDDSLSDRLARAQRNARNARTFRDQAVVNLRRALGLTDEPTPAEIGDWGDAP